MTLPDRAVVPTIDAIDSIITREEWQDRALCAQTDPEAFFPDKGGSTRDAKKICYRCDVQSQCLQYALHNEERFGIWGGYSERERRKIARGIPPEEVHISQGGSPRRYGCGTEAGHRWHLNHNEKPCDDCRAAFNRAQRDRYHTSRREAS